MKDLDTQIHNLIAGGNWVAAVNLLTGKFDDPHAQVLAVAERHELIPPYWFQPTHPQDKDEVWIKIWGPNFAEYLAILREQIPKEDRKFVGDRKAWRITNASRYRKVISKIAGESVMITGPEQMRIV